MTWLTWRQYRAEAGVGAVLLAAILAGLTVIGRGAHNVARQVGVPACLRSGADCPDALERLHRDYHWLPPVTGALVALPLLAGMFWAAPLISREYEAGTHRLVWTQSISRMRWISTRLAITAGVTAAAAAIVGQVTIWALDPLTPAFGTRFNSTWYDIQGIVPIACMLFAFGAGAAASALTRRTIPAMATTLVVFAAARIPIHFFRDQFWPTRSSTFSFPISDLLRSPDIDPSAAVVQHLSPNDWILGTTTFDSAGRSVAGLNDRGVLLKYCPDLPARGDISRAAFASCRDKLSGLSMHQVTRYHPAADFWRIQLVESAIFLTAAAALFALAVFAVVRRRSI
jgi:hypothetical protein